MKMMLPTNYSACLLSFVLLVANAVVAAPCVECDAPTFDFGTLIAQKELVHDFTVWNRGDSELVIKKVRACCGMKASMDSMTIAPGTNATCHVVFDLSTRRGEQSKQVWLATNDPKHPYLDLRLIGVHKAAIDIQPARINLGKLVEGGETVQTLTATNLLTNTVSLLSVSSAAKGIEAEIIESAERSWVIQVTAAPEAVAERLNGSVELNFSSGPVQVPVYGSVVPQIQSVPEKIVLLRKQSKVESSASAEAMADRLTVEGSAVAKAAADKGEESENVEHFAGVTSPGRPAHGQTGMSAPQVSDAVKRQMLLSGSEPFKVLSAELVDAVGEVSFQELRPNRWRCNLSVFPSNIKPGAVLRVLTDCVAQPEISVPLILR